MIPESLLDEIFKACEREGWRPVREHITKGIVQRAMSKGGTVAKAAKIMRLDASTFFHHRRRHGLLKERIPKAKQEEAKYSANSWRNR